MNQRRPPMSSGPDVQPMAGMNPMQFLPMIPPPPPPQQQGGSGGGGGIEGVLAGLGGLAQAIQGKMAGQPALNGGGPVDSPLLRPRQPFPNAMQGATLDRLANQA